MCLTYKRDLPCLSFSLIIRSIFSALSFTLPKKSSYRKRAKREKFLTITHLARSFSIRLSRSHVGKSDERGRNIEKVFVPAIFLWASGLALWVKAATFRYSDWDIKPAASRLPGDMAEYSSLSSSMIRDSMSKKRMWLSGSEIHIIFL